MKILKWQEGGLNLDTQTTDYEDISIYRHDDGKTYLTATTDNDAITICLEELLSEMIEKGLLVIGLNIQ